MQQKLVITKGEMIIFTFYIQKKHFQHFLLHLLIYWVEDSRFVHNIGVKKHIFSIKGLR